jgi:2'-5' RNA ligase
MRLFTAIDIGRLEGLVAALKDLEQTDAHLKIVDPDIIHCTLKFLGEVEERRLDDIIGAMKLSVADTEPFTLTIKGMGVFPNQNYVKVVWVGLEGKPVIAIAERLEQNLRQQGFKKEKRPFTPHATLARVKGVQGKKQLQDVVRRYQDIHFGEIRVDNICLKKSDLRPGGPIYTTLSTIPL